MGVGNGKGVGGGRGLALEWELAMGKGLRMGRVWFRKGSWHWGRGLDWASFGSVKGVGYGELHNNCSINASLSAFAMAIMLT